MQKSSVIAVIATVLPLLPAAEVRAGQLGEGNVAFVITVVDTDPGGDVARRSLRLMAREGARAEVSTGWRIPIPTSTKAADAPPGGEAVTSYSYQDIGVSTWIESQISDQGDVFAHGRIEISSVEPAAKAMSGPITAPTVAAFSQKFGVVLKDGVEMTLAEAPGRDGGSLRLTMSASIER